MAKKTKKRKCRCRACGRRYKAQAGIRFERVGNRMVRAGKSKPVCIGMCDPCFDEKIEHWLKTEDV